jgi:serine protease Do
MRLIAAGIVLMASQLASAQVPASAPAENLRVTNEVRIYQMDKDAVVNIASTRIVNARVGTGDELFDRIFQSPMVRAVPMQSLGSGFVIHAAGYIVTNEHVIDRASEVQVIMADGQKLPAQVLATDTEHDLAILKVNPVKPLQTIALGSSDDLMIGEPVYAIGNPFGYSGSMTRGIVSATARDLTFGENRVYKGLIQTDASINPGNSGGPLINAYGQVIGINTAIRGDAHGIGFAIGVSRLRDLLPGLLNIEGVNRAQIGFRITEKRTLIPPSKVGTQVIVGEVRADSGAAKAGLEAGDQIVRVGDATAGGAIDALVAILGTKPGDTLAVTVLRNNQLVSINVPVTAAPPPESERVIMSRLGFDARTVTPALAKSESLAVNGGVLITSTKDGGPAAKAGLEKGDVIFQLGPYYVNSVEDVATLLKTAEAGLKVQIGLVRGNTRGRTTIEIK